MIQRYFYNNKFELSIIENLFKSSQNSSLNLRAKRKMDNTINLKNQNQKIKNILSQIVQRFQAPINDIPAFQSQTSEGLISNIILFQYQTLKTSNNGIVLPQLQTSKAYKVIISGIQPFIPSILMNFSQILQKLQSPL